MAHGLCRCRRVPCLHASSSVFIPVPVQKPVQTQEQRANPECRDSTLRPQTGFEPTSHDNSQKPEKVGNTCDSGLQCRRERKRRVPKCPQISPISPRKLQPLQSENADPPADQPESLGASARLFLGPRSYPRYLVTLPSGVITPTNSATITASPSCKCSRMIGLYAGSLESGFRMMRRCRHVPSAEGSFSLS